jgi:hypothetical protein
MTLSANYFYFRAQCLPANRLLDTPFSVYLSLALLPRRSYYIEIAGDATEVCSNIRIHFDVRCKEDIFG